MLPISGDALNTDDDLATLALLVEPVRRRLYAYLREQGRAVGREEAAGAVGISTKLAAFHLDRMAEAGLLDVEFRRLGGRVGPGAGRPAKLYALSSRRYEVALPKHAYSLAASIMATALSRPHDGADGAGAIEQVAHEVGVSLGRDASRRARTSRGRRAAARRALSELGCEPRKEPGDTTVLANCIFAEVAESHRALVCRMNAALVRGLLEGARVASLGVENGPIEHTCCVRLVER